ncbi:hypothetical protein AVEN_264740-1 [Araneus ventricosus]|uniref:Uncharacterized protein n=1 Tax=Araneus ventricosus TaxID=182803 RepID=A0A4Y2PIQ3_ARAVE|nr:hypothetical protein AVEN_264740-1 [Araneus ventricosus]
MGRETASPAFWCKKVTVRRSPLKQDLFGRKRHELDSPNLGGPLPHDPTPNLIGPPIALISEAISEPPLPSEEASRLRPAFVAVKGKFLDRPRPPRSV